MPKTEVHRRWQQWQWRSCGLRSSRSWGGRVGRPVASRGDLFTDAHPSLSGSRNTAWPEFRPRYVLRALQVQYSIFHRTRSKDLIKDFFSSRTLTIYTTDFNIIKLYILSIQYVCVCVCCKHKDWRQRCLIDVTHIFNFSILPILLKVYKILKCDFVSFIKIKFLYKNCKSYFYGYTDSNVRRWILVPPSGPSRVGIAIFVVRHIPKAISLEAFDAFSGKSIWGGKTCHPRVWLSQ